MFFDQEWREKYLNSETLTEVRSQTIGVIGFGTIGRLVIERLKGFQPTILVNDPFADADKTIKSYKAMDNEFKKAIESQVKKFMKSRLEVLGIKFDEKTIEEEYKKLC